MPRMNQSSEFIKVDWFQKSWQKRPFQPFVPMASGTGIAWYLWPYSTAYCNPLNPIFLTSVKDLKSLSTKESWFPREGMELLSLFFKKFPEPKSLKSALYFESYLRGIIPEAWFKQVKFYQQTQTAREQSFDTLIFILANPDINWQHSLKLAIEQLEQSLGKRRYARLKKLSLLFEVKGLEPIVWNDFVFVTDLSKSLCVFVGEKPLISDDFISHFASAKGSQIFLMPTAAKSDLDILLSPYHGIRFLD